MLNNTIKLYRNWFETILASSIGNGKHLNFSNKKTLLLIASHLPPNSTGGVFRPLSFIKHAKKNKWHCEAFSLDFPVTNKEAGQFLLNSIEDSACLHRTPLNTLKTSWSLSPRIDGGFSNSLNMFFDVIKKIKYRPHVILATGPSFSSFLTGYYLSKYFHIPLVLDYRDEWTLCPFSWIEKEQLNLFFERKCCKQATKIIFTTDSHLQNHCQAFPDIPVNTRKIIANGFESDDFSTENSLQKSSTYFTLAFIGNLSHHSLPDNFFKNLENLFSKRPELTDKIRIIFAGNKSPESCTLIDNFKFKQIIETHNHLSKENAVQLMKESNALLLLAGKGMSGYIPGKLFDYLASYRPILFYGELGEASSIIENLNAGIVISYSDTTDKLEKAIDSLLYKDIHLDKIKIDAWLSSYERSALATELYLELDTLTDLYKYD